MIILRKLTYGHLYLLLLGVSLQGPGDLQHLRKKAKSSFKINFWRRHSSTRILLTSRVRSPQNLTRWKRMFISIVGFTNHISSKLVLMCVAISTWSISPPYADGKSFPFKEMGGGVICWLSDILLSGVVVSPINTLSSQTHGGYFCSEQNKTAPKLL